MFSFVPSAITQPFAWEFICTVQPNEKVQKYKSAKVQCTKKWTQSLDTARRTCYCIQRTHFYATRKSSWTNISYHHMPHIDSIKVHSTHNSIKVHSKHKTQWILQTLLWSVRCSPVVLPPWRCGDDSFPELWFPKFPLGNWILSVVWGEMDLLRCTDPFRDPH